MKVADHSSSELQSAMSALENAISLLGSVTATSCADAAGADRGELNWTGGVSAEPQWRYRTSKSSSTAVTELSNTLSLLDSTIVAIDSAMLTPSSTFDQQHGPTDVTTDSRRSDVIGLTSGPTEMHPRRTDCAIMTGGGRSSWRGRTALDTPARKETFQLDVTQTGSLYISRVANRPVFFVSWPHCPVSRPRPSRDAKCPVFRPWTNCIEIVQQMYAGP